MCLPLRDDGIVATEPAAGELRLGTSACSSHGWKRLKYLPAFQFVWYGESQMKYTAGAHENNVVRV
jgi:hypothetical protein